MPDYKSMYYHLAGRMATTVEVLEMTVETLEGTTTALTVLTEKLKQAQLKTEDMFINGIDDDVEEKE